jgi:hypothetical protein
MLLCMKNEIVKSNVMMRTGVLYFVVLYIFLAGVCLGQAPVSSPSTDKNYIISNTPLVEGVKEPSQLAGKPKEEVNQTVQYFDGLGRPVQTVNTMASPQGGDIVSPQQYDVFGRELKKYLPYTSSGTPGSFKTNAVNDNAGAYTGSEQYLFYQNANNIEHDQAPLSEVIQEDSPLNRVLKQGAPGTVWQLLPFGSDDKANEYVYTSNQQNEVLLFGYDMSTRNVVMSNLTYYAPNQLYANKTIDEHNHEVIVYVDKDGKTILKKVEFKEENGVKLYAETYYIYDDFGNLIVVLPPEAVVAIKSSLPTN